MPIFSANYEEFISDLDDLSVCAKGFTETWLTKATGLLYRLDYTTNFSTEDTLRKDLESL